METICFNLKLIKLELERKRSGPRALIADTGYNTMTGNPMLQLWISAMKTINQFKERACTLHCLYPAPSAKCIIANPRSSVPMARGMGGSSRARSMPAYFHQNNVVSSDLQEEFVYLKNTTIHFNACLSLPDYFKTYATWPPRHKSTLKRGVKIWRFND